MVKTFGTLCEVNHVYFCSACASNNIKYVKGTQDLFECLDCGAYL